MRGLYRATGVAITGALRLLRLDLRLSGLERLPQRPVLFVANHFTRFETFLLPYAIYRRFRRPVRTLATHDIFRGIFARYLDSVGVLSVRAARRNDTIIGDLVTGRADWIIYPEGGLIKNKKTVDHGRLRHERLGRPRPPHTGAALMALKAELSRRAYAEACMAHDDERRAFYEERYSIARESGVAPRSMVIVPVNVTFPRLRSGRRALVRAARLFGRALHPHLEEELRVEGSLLLGGNEISVHFGAPIDVADHLGGPSEVARRIAGWRQERRRSEVLLRGRARRLTDEAMRRVYGATEVNVEHLFCAALRAWDEPEIGAAHLHSALYLAALELRRRGDVRLHPSLRAGALALTRGEPFPPLDSIVALARAEGVVARRNGTYVIDRTKLEEAHPFHEVRLRKMVQVIANEAEAVEPAVRAVRESLRLRDGARQARTAEAICASDRTRFHGDYAAWQVAGVSKPPETGAPFVLEHPRAAAAVVLVHGYLAAPGQMRSLADHLHARGFTVYGLRLEGHGTSPRQLDHVTWRDWMAGLFRAHAAMRARHDRVVVGGFSLGGTLAAILAAHRAGELDALFTINAPLRLRHPMFHLVPALATATRAYRRFAPESEVGRLRNRSECPDVNYDSDCLHGLRELRRAMRACRRRADGISARTLVIQSERDPVVHPTSARMLVGAIASSDKRLEMVPGDRHHALSGPGSATVFDLVARFVAETVTAPAESGRPWRATRPAI
jgi:esterase/lipase/1-acyl-sn-glycerol-3-phosphate acyltransferase